jgi:CheY-like chemotaxis protein
MDSVHRVIEYSTPMWKSWIRPIWHRVSDPFRPMPPGQDCHSLVRTSPRPERVQLAGRVVPGEVCLLNLPRSQNRTRPSLARRVMNASICLLLVDDHAAFRKPLAMILEREPDLAVVAQAGSLAEARAVLPEIAGRVDVALVDLQLPDGDGVEVVRDVRVLHPQSRVLVLTAVIDPAHHATAIDAGAAAILSKAAQPAEIITSIRRAHADEAVRLTR